jgi:hypothetical protein
MIRYSSFIQWDVENFRQGLTSILHFRQVQLPKPTLSSNRDWSITGFLENSRQIIGSISGNLVGQVTASKGTGKGR